MALTSNIARDSNNNTPATSVDIAGDLLPELLWLSQYEPAIPKQQHRAKA